MSVFLTKKKFLFLHIPRTGGWWVRWALEESHIENGAWIRVCKSNITRSHALLAHHSFRNTRTKGAFTFVRHPIAYYESVWMHFWKHGENSRVSIADRFDWHPHAEQARHWCQDFSEWVKKMLYIEPSWYTRLIDFYVGPEGGEFCKYIGRTERLPDDLVYILRELDYKLGDRQLKQFRVSTKKNISRDRGESITKKKLNWTDQLKDKVEEAEQSVLRRFYGSNENKIRMF